MDCLTESSRFQILIVDDDGITTLFHEKKLKQFDFLLDQISCKNGKEALEYIENTEKHFTEFLVFLDLNMPIMTGWQFLDAIQGKPYLEKLKVVVVSSSLYKTDLLKALNYKQVIGFCQKPLTSENLKEIVGLKEIAPFLVSSKNPEQMV